MNTIFFRKNVFWLLSLSAIAVLGSGTSVHAQTVDNTTSQELTESFGTKAYPNQVSSEVESFYPQAFTPTPAEFIGVEAQTRPISDTNQPQQSIGTRQETAKSVITPVPGTTATSSAVLLADPQKTQRTEAQAQPSTSEVAQADIDPGRPTRGGSSYIGIAGNIGLGGGDSSLSEGSFAIISKIGLTNAISVRPSVLLGDNTTILVPVSYDFSFRQISDPFAEPLPVAPYVGAGAAIKTDDGAEVALLLSGGIDVPLTPQFTATAAVNAAFFDETDIGLSIGVGYNFSGLFGL
ncbi:hypothetical protein BZZ01_24145 [Nostocales cyanobacterium HT-58-2]|nr:hypothetical protein BZZ01_24145 [Nostocales cyanobacterium HT-58-2]